MKRMIKYNSIEQFRTIVKNVGHATRYNGYDEVNSCIIYNNDNLPKITVIGTEKIHGTNAAVCYSNLDGFWVQSRSNIITPEQDNAGCAFNAYQNKRAWEEIIFNLAEQYNIDLNNFIISIYYE